MLVPKHNENIITSIPINISKEKRKLFNMIKKAVFKENGIIYGDFVRDEIIAEHYKNEFNNYIKYICYYNNYDIKNAITNNFWDKKYHPSSFHRTVVSKKISIFFYKKTKLDNFILYIKNLNLDYINDNNIIISNTINNIKYDYIYYNIVIKTKIGKTFVHQGHEIKIKISINCPTNDNTNSFKYDPPFGICSFVYNFLIHTKKGIRLSNTTGTILDGFNSNYDKINIIKNIKNDIVNFNTEICSINCNDDNINTLIYKIIKMTNKNNKIIWTIKNLPYLVDYKNDTDNVKDDLCCICQEKLYNNTEIATTLSKTNNILTKACTLHHLCLLEYIKYQLDKYNYNILCPYKTNIEFKNILPNYNRLLYHDNVMMI